MNAKRILAILSFLCLPLVAAPKMPVRGLCAHRGDAAAFPENTVPAIESAAKKGAAMVEIDVKKKIYALGLDFALTDNLDAMQPFFPTRFADEK